MSGLTVESRRRELTSRERRLLRAKIQRLGAAGRRTSRAYLPIAAAVFAGLWLWTVLASDAHWTVVTLFWLVAGGAITLWVRRGALEEAKEVDEVVRHLESALRRNAADEYPIRAKTFADFEEIEDEGACYAFELEGNRLVFIAGQEFYPGARFPSLDFSLVYLLDEHDQTVDMFIDKRGSRIAPARTFPAVLKRSLDVPEHLEVRAGSLEDLERVLAESSPQTR